VKPVSIHEAKTNLSRLIAQVEQGEEVVVRRRQTPVAKLVPYSPAAKPRTPGALRGRIKIHEGFDEIPPGFPRAGE
jgi:prevent-host-death family protein